MSDSMERLTASFVVPLYNTGGSLPRLLEAFRDLPIKGGYELVLVNDASPDGTGTRVAELLGSLPYPAVLIDMAKNFGEHAAVLEGYRHARGRFIVNLDDDLQNPVAEALRLVDHLRTHDCDVVYTWFEEKMHHPLRNFGSWFTNRAASLLLDKPKDLYLSSFRGIRRELAEKITTYRGPYPYVDGLILGATNRIDRLQVHHEARQEGSSGYTFRKLVRLWMNMFFNFSVMPLRLAGILGLLLCALGAVIVFVVFAEKLMHDTPIQGYASLMAAVSVFSGAQLLILGVIGEYLGRTYLTLAGRPQSLVRSVRLHEPRA
jgi:undecaprenyl-phosphate 4-deoxy-4-formamido-L-arabinose transferase